MAETEFSAVEKEERARLPSSLAVDLMGTVPKGGAISLAAEPTGTWVEWTAPTEPAEAVFLSPALPPLSLDHFPLYSWNLADVMVEEDNGEDCLHLP